MIFFRMYNIIKDTLLEKYMSTQLSSCTLNLIKLNYIVQDMMKLHRNTRIQWIGGSGITHIKKKRIDNAISGKLHQDKPLSNYARC